MVGQSNSHLADSHLAGPIATAITPASARKSSNCVQSPRPFWFVFRSMDLQWIQGSPIDRGAPLRIPSAKAGCREFEPRFPLHFFQRACPAHLSADFRPPEPGPARRRKLARSGFKPQAERPLRLLAKNPYPSPPPVRKAHRPPRRRPLAPDQHPRPPCLSSPGRRQDGQNYSDVDALQIIPPPSSSSGGEDD